MVDDLDRYEAMVTRQFRRPVSLTGLIEGDVEEEYQEISKLPYSSMEPWDVDMLLSSNFEESVHFLPTAFRFVRQRQDGRPELLDQIIFFIRRHQDALRRADLYSITIDHLIEAFWGTIVEFHAFKVVDMPPGYSMVTGGVYASCGSERDSFLMAVLDAGLPADQGTLFARILNEWSSDCRYAGRSGNLIDLFVCSAFPDQIVKSFDSVYHHSCAARLRQNRELVRGHLRACEHILAQEFPPEYREAASRLV